MPYQKRGTNIRVAFVDQTGDVAGGAQESMALLIGNLPTDIEPTVILFQDGGYAQRLRESSIEVQTIEMPRALMCSTREHFGLGGGLAIPGAVVRLAQLIRSRRVDAVYTNSIKAHLIGGMAARLAGVPCVVHFRDILDGRARAAVRLISAACSRERIAITMAVAQAYDLPATTVVDNPLDLSGYTNLPAAREARAQFGLPDNTPIVAIVGRINRWKGHDRFLRIAARVTALADAHFIVVGEPRFRDADFVAELHQLVRSLGLESRTTFVPWIDDVRPLYAAIDIHCNCSTAEPFGRTTIEAAAASVPTVCFRDGGAAEAIVDGVTGIGVSPGDEAAFADAIVYYIRFPAVRTSAGQAARASLERFDVRRHASIVAAILRRVAARTC